MKKKLTKGLNVVLLITFTLIVLYFALKDNFKTIMDQLLNLNIWWLICGFMLSILYYILRSFVMKDLVCSFKKDYSIKKATTLVLSTQFFHAITPFASGGQPYEIYSLKKSGLKLADATNVCIQNFIVYQIALVILGTIAVLLNQYFHFFKQISFLRFLTMVGFTINVAIVIFLYLVTFGKKFNKFLIDKGIKFLSYFKLVKDKEATTNKWNNSLNDFHDGAKQLLKNKKQFAFGILFNFLALVCVYLIPMVMLFSIGDYTSFNGIESIATSAYVMLIGSFVPIPGGTGGLEYSFVQFFGNFIKGASLSSIMLLWRFVTYYFGMIVGAIVFNFKSKE